MKLFRIAILLTLASIVTPSKAFAVVGGSCVPDQNGFISCGQQCYWTNICYSNNFPQEYYCYTYYEPFGCWHDGTYEPCCASKRTF